MQTVLETGVASSIGDPLRHPHRRVALASLAAVILLLPLVPAGQAAADQRESRREARILSAAWGLNNGNKCPTGVTGLDNIPVTFNWFIDPSTISVSDFVITRDDGTDRHPDMRPAVPARRDRTSFRRSISSATSAILRQRGR